MLSRTELIEIQYEISMAIGTSLDLRRMLRTSLSAILKKLNCPIGGVLQIGKMDDCKLSLFPVFSIPFKATEISTIKNAINSLPKCFTQEEHESFIKTLPFKYKSGENSSIHFLELPDFGILYLYAPEDYLKEELLRILQPLLGKLAISAKACIQNKELIQHRQNLEELVAEQTNDLVVQKEELVEMNEQLTELNATKNKFFSIIAHDLKSPFSGVISITSALKANVAQFNEDEISYCIDQINNNARKSFRLLDNLLEWASIQTGRISFNPEVLDLKELVDTNMDLLQRNALDKNLDFVSEVKQPISIVADKEMINTVIRNLITNAIKFTHKEGTVSINCIESNNSVKFHVKDTGVGLSEEQIKKLFKIEETYSTKGTNKESGTGLGLILCQEFIKRHNGEIFITSKPGEGSTIGFSLPVLETNI